MNTSIFKTGNKSDFAEKSKRMARKGTIGAFMLTIVYGFFTSLFTTNGLYLTMAFSLPAICVVFFVLTFSKLKNELIYKLMSYFLIVSCWMMLFIAYHIDFQREYTIVMMTIFILIFQVVPTPKKLILFGSFVFVALVISLLLSNEPFQFIGLISFLFLFSFALSYIVTLQRRDLIRNVNSNSSIMKSLINNTKDAILLVDFFSKEVIDVNERTSKVFDILSSDEFINSNYYTLFADEQYVNKNRVEIKQQINEHGFFNDEILFKTPKGNAFWGHLFLSPFNAEKNNYYILQIRNIDVKKKFDEKIASTYEQYRFILDNLEEFIYLVKYSSGGDANFEYVSPSIERIFGIKKHEFVTPKIQKKIQELYHPDDIPDMKAKKITLFDTKKRVTLKYRVKPLGKDNYIWIEETVIPKLDDDNKIIEVVGILREINS